ncbi:MAG TPA: hypothetical protein VMV77_04775 [Bacteroidales bacterium]|nr:hypothetical protein [Bacteroidales bacterium]
MTQGQRLNIFIKQTFLSYNAFAKKIGLAGAATIYMIRDDKREISPDLAGRIQKIYAQLNMEWLLKGEGNMFLTDDEIKEGKKLVGKVEDKTECLLCKEKDFIIEEYKKIISAQTKLIDELTKK